jgi:hypothetical protein
MYWRTANLAIFSVLLSITGCAPIPAFPLSSPVKNSNPFASAKLPSDAVVLDLAFAAIKEADDKTYAAIWNAADEQSLASELRRNLATNGLRVGIYGQNLPTQLVALLDAKPNLLETISSGDSGELDLDGGRRRLPMRAGHRSLINVSQMFPSLPVLISDDGQVRGQQLLEARCTLSLKSYPLGDGRVKLVLTPEIEHGQPKTRWMGSEGMMIQQTARDRLTLDRLQWEVVLRPGESMVVGATPEHKGLGEYFFTQSTGGTFHNRLLLMRFSQTQFDDLFAREQTSAPLATPGE